MVLMSVYVFLYAGVVLRRCWRIKTCD